MFLRVNAVSSGAASQKSPTEVLWIKARWNRYLPLHSPDALISPLPENAGRPIPSQEMCSWSSALNLSARIFSRLRWKKMILWTSAALWLAEPSSISLEPRVRLTWCRWLHIGRSRRVWWWWSAQSHPPAAPPAAAAAPPSASCGNAPSGHGWCWSRGSRAGGSLQDDGNKMCWLQINGERN